MGDEIKALREEVARLRERVAVLESRPQVAQHIGPITPWPNSFPIPNATPFVSPFPGWLPGTVYCKASKE